MSQTGQRLVGESCDGVGATAVVNGCWNGHGPVKVVHGFEKRGGQGRVVEVEYIVRRLYCASCHRQHGAHGYRHCDESANVNECCWFHV